MTNLFTFQGFAGFEFPQGGSGQPLAELEHINTRDGVHILRTRELDGLQTVRLLFCRGNLVTAYEMQRESQQQNIACLETPTRGNTCAQNKLASPNPPKPQNLHNDKTL